MIDTVPANLICTLLINRLQRNSKKTHTNRDQVFCDGHYPDVILYNIRLSVVGTTVYLF